MSRADSDEVEHVHKCHLCGTEWQHLRETKVSGVEYHALHNCPNPACDGNQRLVHHYVDEVEHYPGEWDKRHRRGNRQQPGGSPNPTKRYKPPTEEEVIDALIERLLFGSN